MLGRIISLFGGRGNETDHEKGFLINFGGISATITDPKILDRLPLADTALNLNLARERGRKPLCFAEVLEQLGAGELANAVLFDTPPFGIGNHWRVIGIDPGESVTLQLCNEFGSLDYDAVSPIQVPANQSFFTGVSLHTYAYQGRDYPLAFATRLVKQTYEASDEYPEGLHMTRDDILFSDAEGNLNRRGYRSGYRPLDPNTPVSLPMPS